MVTFKDLDKEVNMELEVKEYQLPAEIKFNFEELKQEVIAKCSLYESMVYTEDQIKDAKADKASLNKLKKALNDERLRLEREYMKPFESFKSQVKELCTLIDKPVALIDKQITAAEDKRKADKRVEIGSYFVTLERPEWLKLERIFNEKWLNTTYKMQDITAELDMTVTMINNNVTTLNALPEFGFEALEEYKRTLDFNKALLEGQRLVDIQKRKEAQKIAEENAQKAQEEALNAKANELAKSEEKAEIKPISELPFADSEEPKIVQDSRLRTFSGFLTEGQVDALFVWCAHNDIDLMEV